MALTKSSESSLLKDPQQMLLPLLVEIGLNEEVGQQKTDPVLIEGLRQDQPQLDEWTDEELVQLHQFLLEQSLTQALNPRSSKATREEVLDWVDQVTPYKQEPAAFSFDACCRFSGYDSEELREELHNEMRFRRIHPSLLD